MAFEVRLYSFAKKTNSTKRPDASVGTVFNVTYYGEYDLLSPSLVFSFADNTTNPHLYNYVYIPSNDRYYFIDRWVYNSRFWIARCSVDALASWKDTIGGSSQFVERSASTSNPHITDNQYPTTAKLNSTITNPSTFPFVTNFVDGVYIVSVLGGDSADSTTNQGLTYYLLDNHNFEMLQKKLFNGAFGNTLFNRIESIRTCKWFPFAKSNIPSLQNTIIDFPSLGNIILDDAPIMLFSVAPKTFNIDFVLPHHPQYSTHGTFTDYSNTQRVLQWPPVGYIPLDVTKLSDMVGVNDNRIPLKLEVDVDLHTGSGFFRVSSGGLVVTNGAASVSVDVPIATRNADISGIANNSIGGYFSAVSGDVIGTISSIGGVLKSLQPQVRIVGTHDSAIAFTSTKPVVRSDFSVIVAQDVERFGKPYMETTQIKYLSGFVKCVNGEFSSSYATRTEIDEINNYLNGGFYYE